MCSCSCEKTAIIRTCYFQILIETVRFCVGEGIFASPTVCAIVVYNAFSTYASAEDYPPVQTMLEQCGKLKLLDRLLKHLRDRGHKVIKFRLTVTSGGGAPYSLTFGAICPMFVSSCLLLNFAVKEYQNFHGVCLATYFLLSVAGSYFLTDDEDVGYS